MHRTGVLGAVVALVLAVSAPSGFAGNGPVAASVVVNGHAAASTVAALQVGGTWYFDAGGLLPALGLRLSQTSSDSEVAAAGQDMRLGLTAGSTTAYLDGAAIDLGSAPLQEGGAVFVPFSLVGLLGGQATWYAPGLALTIDDPGLEPTASVTAASGAVQLVTGGGAAATATPGQALAPGDSLVTAGNGSAQIQMSDGSLIDVAPNSNVELTALGTGATAGSRAASFQLVVGRILARIFDLGGGLSQLTVKTPTAVIGDRGTTFLIEVAPTGATTTDVLSGEVTQGDAGGAGTPVTIGTDQQSEVPDAEAAATPPAAAGGLTIDTWLANAVADAAVARAAEALSSQLPAASQQALLTTSLPTIQRSLDLLSGQPYEGHVRTSGGAGADLGAQGTTGNGNGAGTPGQPVTNPAAAPAQSGGNGHGSTGAGSGSSGQPAAGGGTNGNAGGNSATSNGNAGANSATSNGNAGGNSATNGSGTGSSNAGGNSGISNGNTGGNSGTSGSGTGSSGNAGGNSGTSNATTGGNSATNGSGTGSSGNAGGSSGTSNGNAGGSTTNGSGTGSGSTAGGNGGASGSGTTTGNGTGGNGNGTGSTGGTGTGGTGGGGGTATGSAGTGGGHGGSGTQNPTGNGQPGPAPLV